MNTNIDTLGCILKLSIISRRGFWAVALTGILCVFIPSVRASDLAVTGNLTVSANSTVSGTSTVSGNTTISGDVETGNISTTYNTKEAGAGGNWIHFGLDLGDIGYKPAATIYLIPGYNVSVSNTGTTLPANVTFTGYSPNTTWVWQQNLYNSGAFTSANLTLQMKLTDQGILTLNSPYYNTPSNITFDPGNQSISFSNGLVIQKMSTYLALGLGTSGLVVGNNSAASGTGAMALGANLTANSLDSVTVGHYNSNISGNGTTWVATDPAFIVGTGNSSTPANGLVVLNNGNTTIGGDGAINGNETVGGNITVSKTLGSTSVDGLVLSNPTAATSGNLSQNSPRIRLSGSSYGTYYGSAWANDYTIQNSGNGGSFSTPILTFNFQNNGGGYSLLGYYDPWGTLHSSNGFTAYGGGFYTYYGSFTTSASGLGTTPADGLTLYNPSAATSGTPVQYSSSVHQTGSGWTGSASQQADWRSEVHPINGTSPITSNLVWSSQINSAGYNVEMQLSSNGNLTIAGGATIPGNVTIGGNTTNATISGNVTMNKRQGDIIMGLFGNGGGD
jgi:hypothetical protein